MTTKRLTTVAMLTAMYVVLSILTPIKLIDFKFTFEALPILVAALLAGPIDGMLVGGLGSTIYQLFFSGYGITVTTPLWILPHLISGLIVGLLAQWMHQQYSFSKVCFISSISALTVTAFNTLALYVDSKIFGYYSDKLVFGSLAIKVLSGICLAVLYSIILPKILKTLKNITQPK